MNIKIIAAIISTVIALLAFWPYIKDILRGKTKPHAYTWFIWVIVQGIATAGILHGGGKWGALELAIATSLVFVVFLLSFKHGTKNITKSDTASLIGALGALLIWLVYKNASLAVLIVTVIDLIGFWPTIRKTYFEPWTETQRTWLLFTIGNLFSLLALDAYNFLTLVFIVLTTIGNALMAGIIWHRRRVVKVESMTHQQTETRPIP
jgi:hypothetical protein